MNNYIFAQYSGNTFQKGVGTAHESRIHSFLLLQAV